MEKSCASSLSHRSIYFVSKKHCGEDWFFVSLIGSDFEQDEGKWWMVIELVLHTMKMHCTLERLEFNLITLVQFLCCALVVSVECDISCEVEGKVIRLFFERRCNACPDQIPWIRKVREGGIPTKLNPSLNSSVLIIKGKEVDNNVARYSSTKVLLDDQLDKKISKIMHSLERFWRISWAHWLRTCFGKPNLWGFLLSTQGS